MAAIHGLVLKRICVNMHLGWIQTKDNKLLVFFYAQGSTQFCVKGIIAQQQFFSLTMIALSNNQLPLPSALSCFVHMLGMSS